MQARISDPVMVYHPDHSPRKVWRVDLNDYVAIGWSLSPVDDLAKVTIPDPMPATSKTVEVEIDPKTRRLNELTPIIGAKGGWEEIKAIAAIHNININQKPKGGWDEAIGLILAAEYPEVA